MKSLFHLVKFLVGLDSAISQVTDRELQMLLHYSRGANVICELGCYEARTGAAFALNTDGTVYSVDPFYHGRLGICYTELVARVHRRREGASNLVFLKGLSLDVASIFDCPIDFLFIDADHSYEAVKADWAAWMPKIANKGYIGLHDSKLAVNSPQPLGSMRFYSEDIQGMTNVIECDTVDSLVILQTRCERGEEKIHEGASEVRGQASGPVSIS